MTSYQFCSKCGGQVGFHDRRIETDGKQYMSFSVDYTFKDGNLLCRSCWIKL